MKNKPRVGDVAWEVGWCTEIPTDENGDADMDRAKDKVRRFPTKEEAIEFAKKVFPSDAFGCVSICEVSFEAYDEDHAMSHPYVGFWEASKDPQYMSDGNTLE